MKKIISLFCLIFCIFFLTACENTAKFKIAYGNRLDADIDAVLNGNNIGMVLAGEAREFTIELEILDSSPTSPHEPEMAYATASARNRKTGKLSRSYPITLYTDRSTYIEVNPWDFPE
ncbi:MAG: hypothetical protein QMD65_01590 [Patescibacteria group bacterium]|nr:hypothetical protein [Patescibacteria group bacterium]